MRKQGNTFRREKKHILRKETNKHLSIELSPAMHDELTDVSTVTLSDFSDPYNEPAEELCSDEDV
jgi:hypothetical protein